MNGKFRSIEEIFDWYLKTIEIKSDRKAIERYLKNKNQTIKESNLIRNDLIEDILESIEVKNELKDFMRTLFINFIEVYKYFTQYIELHNYPSQKQIDFLIAKDILIPFFALFSSYIFDKHLIILKQVKPDKCKMSFFKFLEWAEKNICQQDIKKYFMNKYKDDNLNVKTYDSIRKSIDSWLDLEKQTIPKKNHFETIIKYLKDCKKAPHLNLKNLALFSKLFQSIHKELKSIFTHEEIELLIEHYYCLLDFYSIQSLSCNIHETEDRVYNELLNHIDPSIINRNHYFNEYFIWIQKIVERDYFTPYKLVKKALHRNKIFYELSEKDCLKFIKLSIPVSYYLKKEPQNEYLKLIQSFSLCFDDFSKGKEVNDLFTDIFLCHLDRKKEKNYDDKVKCNELFERLKNDFGLEHTDRYLCYLKIRYFIFDDNIKEALKYCKLSVKLGVGNLGEHFKEIIMMGILLSAKNNSKRDYNFFRTTGIKHDSFFIGNLKIPAYGNSGSIFNLPEDKSNFEEFKIQYDEYFCNKFQ